MTLEDDPSLAGQTLLGGKLVVERKLGEGGMGVVYRVTHQRTAHARALKVLHAQLAKEPDVVKRFEREASVAGTLNSPRVVETFDAGVLASGAPYVLMELLEGEALSDRLQADGTLPPPLAARFAIEACEGLVAAHAAGIVHRDLKPENLFVTRGADGDEHIKLLDFGISKFRREDGAMTATGSLLGTPMYMAPEQTEGADRADERSDLYAIGVILYEALSGHVPFDAPSLPKLLIQVHGGERAPLSERAPDLDPALAAIVDKAMALAPEDRFESASALIRALEPFAGSDSGADTRTAYATSSASLSPRVEAPAKPSAGPSAVWWLAATALVALMGAGGWWSLRSRATPAAETTDPAIEAPPAAPEVQAETIVEPETPEPDPPPVEEANETDVAAQPEAESPARPREDRRPPREPPTEPGDHSRATEHGLDSENPF